MTLNDLNKMNDNFLLGSRWDNVILKLFHIPYCFLVKIQTLRYYEFDVWACLTKVLSSTNDTQWHHDSGSEPSLNAKHTVR